MAKKRSLTPEEYESQIRLNVLFFALQDQIEIGGHAFWYVNMVLFFCQEVGGIENAKKSVDIFLNSDRLPKNSYDGIGEEAVRRYRDSGEKGKAEHMKVRVALVDLGAKYGRKTVTEEAEDLERLDQPSPK